MTKQQYRDGIISIVGKVESKQHLKIIYDIASCKYSDIPRTQSMGIVNIPVMSDERWKELSKKSRT